MSLVFVFATVLFVVACVLAAIAIKNYAKLERRNRLNEELISRQTETNKAYGECLRAIIIECHGIIGKSINQQSTDQQEKALITILTECSATLGVGASDTVFATLEANERSHYKNSGGVLVPSLKSWSELSELQAKHATEKKKRKEENPPGFGKFRDTLDEAGEPVKESSFEPGNDTIPAQRPNQV